MASYKLYELLGVSPDSSVEEIKTVYREIARRHHSNRYESGKERLIAEERFKKITSAYHIILSNKMHGMSQDSAVSSVKKEKLQNSKEEKNPEDGNGEVVDHEEGRTTALDCFENGKCSFEKGDYKNAVIHFKNAIRFYPDDGMFYNYLGLSYAKQKLFKMAISSFEKALSIDVNSVLFQKNFGLTLEESGDLIMAKVHFAEALRLDPNDKISGEHLLMVRKKWIIITKQKVTFFLYITSGIVLMLFLAFIYYTSN